MLTISTFICARDHQPYLKAAANSILQQSMRPKELILIDDGSKDDTYGEMLEVQRSSHFVPIKLFRHPTAEGHIASYNEAIRRCTGDVIHLMASDDVVCDPHFYREGVEQLEAHPDCGFVTGKLQWINENGERISQFAGPPFDGYKDPIRWFFELSKLGNFICGGAVLIRRSLQLDIGDYDPTLPYSADFANWIKALGKGVSGYALPNIVYLYRRHSNQMTHNRRAPEEERRACRMLLDKLAEPYLQMRLV